MATTIFNQLVQVDTLTFDNVDLVRVSPRIRVTDHPVEFGVEVSDHAQSEPLTIAIRGRISETPLSLAPTPAAVETALGFFERNERQLVTVSTSRGVFADMILQQYDWQIDGRRGIVFDVILRKVRIAFSIAVAIPARTPAPAVEAGAASEVSAGVQPPIPTPPPASVLATAAAFVL